MSTENAIAPNNGPTWKQKNQDCLNKINSTPDGKFYNFFNENRENRGQENRGQTGRFPRFREENRGKPGTDGTFSKVS